VASKRQPGVMFVIDSILTLTKGEIGWLALFFVIFVGLDRILALLVGLPVTLFALFALMIAVFFVVAGIYTLAKLLLGLGKRSEP
jgi:hypothetical protein